MKVAADAELLHLHFVGTENFAGPAHGVVGRMVEIGDVVGVEANFRREKFRIPVNVFGAGIAVKPGPVRVRKGFDNGGFCIGGNGGIGGRVLILLGVDAGRRARIDGHGRSAGRAGNSRRGSRSGNGTGTRRGGIVRSSVLGRGSRGGIRFFGFQFGDALFELFDAFDHPLLALRQASGRGSIWFRWGFRGGIGIFIFFAVARSISRINCRT